MGSLARGMRRHKTSFYDRRRTPPPVFDKVDVVGMLSNPVFAGVGPFDETIPRDAWIETAAGLVLEHGEFATVRDLLLRSVVELNATMREHATRDAILPEEAEAFVDAILAEVDANDVHAVLDRFLERVNLGLVEWLAPQMEIRAENLARAARLG